MAEKTKRIIWVVVLILASYFALTLSDKEIFPRRNVEKIISVKGYSQTYNIKKTLTEPNPKDLIIKIGLVAIAIIAYWIILGFAVPAYGPRLVIFIVSIPVIYICVVYLAFATQFR